MNLVKTSKLTRELDGLNDIWGEAEKSICLCWRREGKRDTLVLPAATQSEDRKTEPDTFMIRQKEKYFYYEGVQILEWDA